MDTARFSVPARTVQALDSAKPGEQATARHRLMIGYLIIVIGSLVLLTGSALFALHWALRSGQFRFLSRTALQVFDDEEPVGRLADRFPDATRSRSIERRQQPEQEGAA